MQGNSKNRQVQLLPSGAFAQACYAWEHCLLLNLADGASYSYGAPVAPAAPQAAPAAQ